MSSRAMNVSLKCNGYRWETARDFAGVLRETIAPNVDRLETLAGCEVIKTNSGRTVIRMEVGGDSPRTIVIKRHRVRDWKEALKYCFVRSRARAERDMLWRMRGAGIPCPTPIAVGERRQRGVLRGACLVLEYIPSDGSLSNMLAGGVLSERERRALVRKLGKIVRAMHDSGLDHRDLHAGNVLVRRNEGGEPNIWFIDCHRARTVRRMSLRGRAEGLGSLVAGVGGITTLAERCRLVRSYLGSERAWPRSQERKFARMLAGRVEGLRKAHRRSRTNKCLKDGSSFARERIKGGVVYRRRDFALSDVLRCVELHYEALRTRGEELLKDDVKTAVTDVSLAETGRGVCVKEFKSRAFPVGLVRRLSGSKGKKAWRAANGLLVRGIKTPMPLAFVEKRRAGIAAGRTFLITESARDHRQASSFLRDSGGEALLSRNPIARDALIEKIGETLGKMHEVGAYHRDFRPANLLACWAGEEWGVLVVDLEDVSLNHFPSRRERRRSFVGLFDQSDMMGGADRERFLEAYNRQCRIDIGEYRAGIERAARCRGGGVG